MAQVIALQSVSRTQLSSVLADMDINAFNKALAVVTRLHACTASERCETLENWLVAGLITVAEHAATLEYYGYRRAKA